jgi:hypothetical protein
MTLARTPSLTKKCHVLFEWPLTLYFFYIPVSVALNPYTTVTTKISSYDLTMIKFADNKKTQLELDKNFNSNHFGIESCSIPFNPFIFFQA